MHRVKDRRTLACGPLVVKGNTITTTAIFRFQAEVTESAIAAKCRPAAIATNPCQIAL